MSSFDAKKYRDEVLKPYSRGEGYEQLREVLAAVRRDPRSTAYSALELRVLLRVPRSTPELKEWHREIVPALNKFAQLPAAQLLKQLLEVMAAQGLDLTSLDVWREIEAEHRERSTVALRKGIEQLSGEYPLGVVTLEKLTARLVSLGLAETAPESIIVAARSHGLAAVKSFAPSMDGMPDELRVVWQQVAKHTEFRSVCDILLLHRADRPRDIRFVTSLRDAAGPITLVDIGRARAKSEQGRDSDALQDAQKFLGALSRLCTDESQLRRVVVATLTERVSRDLQRGKPQVAVRDRLTADGLHREDASQLVFELGSAEARNSRRTGLDTVLELLERGALDEAERMLGSIPQDPDEASAHDAVTAQLAALKARKSASLSAYRSAMASRDFDAAVAAIGDAMTIDRADPSLRELREEVPLPAPASLQLRHDDSGIKLRWARVAGATDGYTVVRAVGQAPEDPTDGIVLVEALETTDFRDQAPPTTPDLWYAVFASSKGRVRSDPATAEIESLMRPEALEATAEATRVELNWRAPSGAAGSIVKCLDPSGTVTTTTVAHGSRLVVEGLVTGTSYRFSVCAIYLFDSGRRLSSTADVTVTPRGTATVVHDLTIASATVDGSDVVTATFTPGVGFEAELWLLPRTVEVPPRERTSEKQLRHLGGTRITTVPGTGRRATVRLQDQPDVVRAVVLTVTDSERIAGSSALIGAPPPPRNVCAEQFSGDLRLSWHWPPGDVVMSIDWKDLEQLRTERVTRTRYRRDGGVKLPHASEIRDLTICTVVTLEGTEMKSAALPIVVESSQDARSSRYSLRIKRTPFSGRTSCTVEAVTTSHGFSLPVDVVVKQGLFMPLSADDGHVATRLDLDFSIGPTATATVELGRLRSPFWVCLFPRDGSELTAPPTAELKG